MGNGGSRATTASIAVIAIAAIAGAGLFVAGSESATAKTELKSKGKKKGKNKKKKNKKKKSKSGANTRHSEVLFVGNNWEGTADILRWTPPSSETTCEGKKKSGKKKSGKKRGKGGKGKKSDATAEAAKKKTKKKKKRKKQRCKPRSGNPDDARVAKKKKKKKAKKDRKKEKTTEYGGSIEHLGRLNIIPDYQQRVNEVLTDPVRLVYFLAVRLLIGEGNDQYVDDMYSTKDGKNLIVSRPSFRDVVSINIATGQINWRFVVAGQRSDHMAISPDGRNVAVSASTGNVVHILDTETGKQVGIFGSGDSPHENTYSTDGKRIYHASIGLVYTPADLPILDTTKGDRYFQVVDATTNTILKRIDMGQKLAQAGYPGMSAAVRPMAITRDERYAYLQVSFFHGVVVYDLVNDKVVQVAHLPNHIPNLPPELYLLDSAHHGIALNGKDTKLCVAGTMSDYAAIVDRSNLSDYKLIYGGTKPYWSTTSEDGKYCYVSWSGTDSISIIDYETRSEVAKFKVGDHPQRIRTGMLATGTIKQLRKSD